MKNFFSSIKIFYKNIFLVVSYVSLLGFLYYNFINTSKALLRYNQPSFVFFSSNLELSIVLTIFFIFFTYILFSKIKKSFVEETLISTKNGYISLTLNLFLLVILLILIVALITIVFNLINQNTDLNNTKYLLHMLSGIFVYLFLVPFTGALVGACCALVFKPLSAYMFMVIFVLLSSPLASIIAFTVAESTSYKVDVSPIFYIFNLYPVSLDYAPNYAFGISLLPYKIESILFWIFCVATVFIIRVTKRTQKVSRVVASICALVCGVNFICFFQPSSKLDMSYRVEGALISDQEFYNGFYGENYPEEQSAEFKVLSYDLDIKVKKQLYVTAKVKVDKEDLSVYKFTLYHNYKISKVTDQNGKELSFKQNVDNVEVYSKEAINQIVFTYSGYNSRFYSNSQGVFLPGYFAYYPIAGQWNIYTEDLQDYATNLLAEEASFNLTVDSPKEIFTNISKDNTGGFTGKTNGLTIMSGFFESEIVDNIEVVYPSFNTCDFTLERMESDIKNFLSVKEDDVVKKIFIVPNVNQKSDSVVVYSDYVTCEQIMALPDRYTPAKISYTKRKLYTYQKMYLDDRENFQSHIENEADPSYPPQLDKLATLYQSKIDELGEDFVIDKTNVYLFDKNDKRSIIQFLNEIAQ